MSLLAFFMLSAVAAPPDLSLSVSPPQGMSGAVRRVEDYFLPATAPSTAALAACRAGGEVRGAPWPGAYAVAEISPQALQWGGETVAPLNAFEGDLAALAGAARPLRDAAMSTFAEPCWPPGPIRALVVADPTTPSPKLREVVSTLQTVGFFVDLAVSAPGAKEPPPAFSPKPLQAGSEPAPRPPDATQLQDRERVTRLTATASRGPCFDPFPEAVQAVRWGAPLSAAAAPPPWPVQRPVPVVPLPRLPPAPEAACEAQLLSEGSERSGPMDPTATPRPEGRARVQDIRPPEADNSVRKFTGQLVYCYEAALVNMPKLAVPDADFSLTVVEGVVTAAKIHGTDNVQLQKCVLGKVARWRFPPDLNEVHFSVAFTPVEAPGPETEAP